MDKFIDRHDAGIILAKELKDYTHKPGVIVLALPRDRTSAVRPLDVDAK